jgi:hypothetical protein
VNAIEDTVEMQQRRALLKRVAWMLGGAVSAPTALAILQGCSAKETPAGVAWTPRFLDATQATLISALADVFIPTTDTRGALDAGVPAFIDSIMADVYPKDAQERFKAGIEEFGQGKRQEFPGAGCGPANHHGEAGDRNGARDQSGSQAFHPRRSRAHAARVLQLEGGHHGKHGVRFRPDCLSRLRAAGGHEEARLLGMTAEALP